MIRTVASVMKWASLPVLLITSLFLFLAASYGPLAGFVIVFYGFKEGYAAWSSRAS